MDPLPPGLFQAAQQGGVKPPGPIVGPKPGVKASTVDSFDGLFLPAAVMAAAVGAGAESKSFSVGIKAVTGFKMPPAGGPGIPTPFALGLLAPQPAGFLPEQFFMSKPKIPGTEIYLDPFYIIKRQGGKLDQRQQRAAAVSQRIQFERLLEDLSEDDLRRLIGKERLAATYLQFLDPRYVNDQVREELNQRRVKQGIRERAAQLLTERAEDDVRRSAIILFLYVDALFAANPPDP